MNPFVSAYREALEEKSPTEQRLRAVKKALDEISTLSYHAEGALGPKGLAYTRETANEALDLMAQVPEVSAQVDKLRALFNGMKTVEKEIPNWEGNEVKGTRSSTWIDPKSTKAIKPEITALTKALRELRAQLESQDRAEKGIRQRQARDAKAAAKAPVTPAAHRSTHSGTCQFCSRFQKLPAGTLANHGYEVRWSEFQGTCPGSGRRPLEETCEDLKAAMPGYRTRQRDAERLSQEPATDEKQKKERALQAAQARQLAGYIAEREKVIASWKPGELRPH